MRCPSAAMRSDHVWTAAEHLAFLALVRSVGLVGDLATPQFPATCGWPLGREPTLRTACTRMPSTLTFPACGRKQSGASILYIIDTGRATSREHLELSTGEADFRMAEMVMKDGGTRSTRARSIKGVAEVDLVHAEVEIMGRRIRGSSTRVTRTTHERRVGCGGTDEARQRETARKWRRRGALRGAIPTRTTPFVIGAMHGDQEIAGHGHLQTDGRWRITGAELGRRIVGEWMDRAHRRGTAWRRRRARALREARNIYTIPSITTIILTVIINLENVADTPMGQLGIQGPFEVVTEHLVIGTTGAWALGVATTPRRYRPLALATKERGVWLTSQAWLRRATVSWYKNVLYALWIRLVLMVVRGVPLATARARAMSKGWAAMATAAAAAARGLAPARSSFASWEEEEGEDRRTRGGVYGQELMPRLANPAWYSAAAASDEVYRGKLKGVTLQFTPILTGIGLVTAPFLKLFV